MSAFLPEPLTIVVFSLSIITFLVRPSMAIVTFSILMPRSCEIACLAVINEMSCRIQLAEHQCGGGAVQEEVVPFERGPNTGRQDHAQTRAIVSLGCDLRHRFPR